MLESRGETGEIFLNFIVLVEYCVVLPCFPADLIVIIIIIIIIIINTIPESIHTPWCFQSTLSLSHLTATTGWLHVYLEASECMELLRLRCTSQRPPRESKSF